MIPHRPEWLVGSVDDLRRLPPPWPVQRDCAQHANVEVPLLLSAKVAAAQDPVRSRGERLVFTSNGVRNYVDQLARVVQLRVAIERCCSFEEWVASFGALPSELWRTDHVHCSEE
ncbi:unnamed protein product [Urochloa humidicola]